ncbi:energy transducer TonB [Granulicella arctica]|uniref:energy transducer TonB n=1 Tax=Granulicella arctica TaxID=940613 RepID=UPI0021DF92F8|nr:energy transducer TonB [Granulicella arctica]
MGKFAAIVLLGVCSGCANKQSQGPLTSVSPVIGLPPIPIDTTRPGLDVQELPSAETMAATQRTVRVAADVEASMIERRPVSVGYPAEARQQRLRGHVLFRAIVGVDGHIQGLTLVETTSPLFVRMATANVQSWQYRPYVLNGRPTAVDTFVRVEFLPPS